VRTFPIERSNPQDLKKEIPSEIGRAGSRSTVQAPTVKTPTVQASVGGVAGEQRIANGGEILGSNRQMLVFNGCQRLIGPGKDAL
jgi:hypothetical protein